MTYLCYVYKIINSEDDKIYIGSTRQTLTKRMWTHKKRYAYNKCKYTVYEHMRKWGFDKFTIVELGRREVEDKQRQFMFEVEWQEKLSHSLNMKRAYTSPKKREKISKIKYKEYRITHKEEIVAAEKKYRTEHQDQISQWKKGYSVGYQEKRRQRSAQAILDRLYECDKCNKCFGRNSCLTRHSKKCTLSDTED